MSIIQEFNNIIEPINNLCNDVEYVDSFNRNIKLVTKITLSRAHGSIHSWEELKLNHDEVAEFKQRFLDLMEDITKTRYGKLKHGIEDVGKKLNELKIKVDKGE